MGIIGQREENKACGDGNCFKPPHTHTQELFVHHFFIWHNILFRCSKRTWKGQCSAVNYMLGCLVFCLEKKDSSEIHPTKILPLTNILHPQTSRPSILLLHSLMYILPALRYPRISLCSVKVELLVIVASFYDLQDNQLSLLFIPPRAESHRRHLQRRILTERENFKFSSASYILIY